MSSRLHPVNDLVTIDMIAKRLGVSIARVKNFVYGRDSQHPHRFPLPIVGKGTRGVWSWEAVHEWDRVSKATEVDKLRRAAKKSKGDRRQWRDHAA